MRRYAKVQLMINWSLCLMLLEVPTFPCIVSLFFVSSVISYLCYDQWKTFLVTTELFLTFSRSWC